MSTPDFFGGCSPQTEHARAEHNHNRFLQLNGLVTSHAEGCWQYLLAVNGGGAVAALTFIGAVEGLRSKTWPYVVLAIFVLGLVLVGAGRAFMVHHASRLKHGWIDDTGAYFEGRMAWSMVLEADNERVKPEWIAWALGWAAFIAFLVGVAVAVFKLHGAA